MTEFRPGAKPFAKVPSLLALLKLTELREEWPSRDSTAEQVIQSAKVEKTNQFWWEDGVIYFKDWRHYIP